MAHRSSLGLEGCERLRIAIIAGLALLLALPAAVGQTTEELIWSDGEEGQLMRWRIEEFNENNGGAPSFSNNVTWLKFSSHEKAIPQSILFVEIRFTATLQGTDDGDWNYTFETNTNTTWIDCSWILPTRDPGALGGSPVSYATFSVSCANTLDVISEDEEFTWWINRTVESGSPDVPLAQHLSIRMDRGDFVVYPMDLDVNTSLDQFIPVLFWFGITLLSLKRGWLFVASWSIIASLGIFYAAWPLSNTTHFIGLLLAICAQAIADGAYGKAVHLRIRRLFGGEDE